jgi:receptor protein-tyrosine kinase
MLMALREYLAMARRWWWLVALGCVLAGGAAWILTSQMTPVYRAKAVLLVNQAQNPSTITYSDILGSQQLTKTYAELATANVNIERAAERLNDPTLPAATIRAKVSARAVAGTQLIHVTADDTSPQRAALVANTLADVFPSYIQEAQLAGTTDGAGRPLNTVFVAEQANAPSAPVRPNKLLNTVLGAFFGLMLMVGTVAVVEYLDDGIDEREDVEALGLPFLGNVMLAHRPKGTDRNTWVPSIGQSDMAPMLAESYRQVQASLAFALSASEAKVILVTSASQGEGKSTTASNLAEALAESNKRVLLVDGDLRKPDVHRYFALPNSSGLSSSFLTDVTSLPAFIKKASERLYVLTSGPVPPNPTELLSSKKMESTIKRASQDFDLIVIDSPPLLGLADASLWASLCDGIVLVAWRSKTRRGTFSEAVAVARTTHKPIVGVIINASRSKGAGSYYYRYGYGYGKQEKAG